MAALGTAGHQLPVLVFSPVHFASRVLTLSPMTQGLSEKALWGVGGSLKCGSKGKDVAGALSFHP